MHLIAQIRYGSGSYFILFFFSLQLQQTHHQKQKVNHHHLPIGEIFLVWTYKTWEIIFILIQTKFIYMSKNLWTISVSEHANGKFCLASNSWCTVFMNKWCNYIITNAAFASSRWRFCTWYRHSWNKFNKNYYSIWNLFSWCNWLCCIVHCTSIFFILGICVFSCHEYQMNKEHFPRTLHI